MVVTDRSIESVERMCIHHGGSYCGLYACVRMCGREIGQWTSSCAPIRAMRKHPENQIFLRISEALIYLRFSWNLLNWKRVIILCWVNPSVYRHWVLQRKADQYFIRTEESFELLFFTLWPESVSELYWPSDRRLSAKLMPTFADGRVSFSQRGRSRTAIISVF
jgi:hypothetical protein